MTAARTNSPARRSQAFGGRPHAGGDPAWPDRRAPRRRSGRYGTFLVLLLQGLAVSAAEPPPIAPRRIPFQMAAATPVGEPFLGEAIAGWSSIPEPVWQGVERAGWRVRLAEFVVDAAPALRNVRPRGWTAPYTWSHTDAVNLPGSRLLVLAEKRLRPGGEVVYSDRVAGVFRHEIGHAFDRISGRRYRYNSATPAFHAAYARDVEHLSQDNRQELRYYLQRQPAGRQETFAEAFAVQLGGGSDVTKRPAFERAFPEVRAFVQAQIDGFKPFPSTSSVHE